MKQLRKVSQKSQHIIHLGTCLLSKKWGSEVQRNIPSQLFHKWLPLLTLQLQSTGLSSSPKGASVWVNNLIITIRRSVKSKVRDEKILQKAEHLDNFHLVIQYLLNTCLTLRTLLSTVKWKDDKKYFCLLEVHGLLREMMNTQIIPIYKKVFLKLGANEIEFLYEMLF